MSCTKNVRNLGKGCTGNKGLPRLFAFSYFDLNFTDEAVRTIAELAIQRKMGARWLRQIIEDLMLDLMYEIPNRDDVASVKITRGVVAGETKPLLRRKADKAAA